MAQTTQEFRLPELGEGIYEAEFVRWLVQPGDTVGSGQPLMEVLTDKATMEVPAPFAGTIAELLAEPGQKLKIGVPVLRYLPASGERAPSETSPLIPAAEPAPARAPVIPAAPTRTSNGEPQTATTSAPVKAAPSVRLMARKLGLDLSRIHGSGPHGRILIEDLSAHLAAPVLQPRPSAKPPLELGKPGQRLKLQGVRRTIAEHMVLSKRTIPHYSYVDECDLTDLVRLRNGLKEEVFRQGVKLTYLSFIIRAVVGALKQVPLVNASLDEASQEIVLHDRYHIGVAVATPSGLLVPVIHDADRKDVFQIAREVERLSEAARLGQSRREDLRGGTFTVTSIGSIGGLISTPVINHPQVGILGVGKVIKRPVYDEHGQIRPADLVYLSFSFDHRVVDGAVGATFGNAVLTRLQNPATLLLPAAL